jgi:dolichol-phosphate mannosyltransferase
MNLQSASAPQLSLIVPTYNERENLPTLADRVHRALKGYHYELIIVDDNSPDGTAELAENLSHKYPVRLICRKGERGLASAVVAGFNYAKGEILGVIDADLQHPPERVPELLQQIEGGADVAVASRYIPGGSVGEWGILRRIISKGATILARMLPSIRKVKDPLSGFFLMRREVIEDIELKPVGYKILLEVLARGRINGVKEVPYTFGERTWGESKLDLREQINYLQHLFVLASEEREIRRFFQFCLVGASGVGVNEGILWLLTEPFGLPHHISPIFSIEASIISNFILNDIWTFRDRREGSIKATLGRALKFNLVAVIGAAITYGVYLGLKDLAEIHYLLSMPLAVVVGFIWNFTMSIIWAWRRS